MVHVLQLRKRSRSSSHAGVREVLSSLARIAPVGDRLQPRALPARQVPAGHFPKTESFRLGSAPRQAVGGAGHAARSVAKGTEGTGRTAAFGGGSPGFRTGRKGGRRVAYDQGVGGVAVQPRRLSGGRGDASGLGRRVRLPRVRSDVQPPRPTCEAHGVATQSPGGRRRCTEGLPLRGVPEIIRAQRHADATHASPHGRQTVHVPRLRPSLFAERSPVHAPAHPHRRKAVQMPAMPVRRLPTRYDYASHANARTLRATNAVAPTARRQDRMTRAI